MADLHKVGILAPFLEMRIQFTEGSLGRLESRSMWMKERREGRKEERKEKKNEKPRSLQFPGSLYSAIWPPEEGRRLLQGFHSILRRP